MTNNKLIMPKQTGKLNAFIASLKLFYESYKKGEDWYSNDIFKIKIKEELPYLAVGAQNGPYLVKQSELTRYFGLAYYDYTARVGRTKITPEGIKFYEAFLDKNDELQKDIIMQSIFNNTFGRNNTAIESSNSDVDAPKLFIKAILDLNGITRKELAYLLYVTHDLQINYNDAILELSKSNDFDREIPLTVANKYSDVKFTVFLTELGLTIQDENRKYQFANFIQENYVDRIKNLTIYNKEPQFILTLNEDDLNDYSDEENLINIDVQKQERILISYVYDTNSTKFIEQNNRKPIPYKKGNTTRYKTNSRIAKTAIDLSEYKCKYSQEHNTFISKLGKPYMEAHHLVPMSAQKDFEMNIDRVENIVSLCPICHSAIHLGNESVRLELLKKIFDLKQAELNNAGINISFGELFTKYYK